jgi:hypothetical protein
MNAIYSSLRLPSVTSDIGSLQQNGTTIMTNANELNLHDLDQVNGGVVVDGVHFNTPAQAAVFAHEIKELTTLMTQHLPPHWQHPLHF